MNGRVAELVAFVQQFYSRSPDGAKDVVAHATAEHFGLKRVRSLYIGPDFSIRFSIASRGGLSNTILSLSALKPHDCRPLIVCVLRETSVEFLMANSTFLRKVSHSSRTLSANNVRGSFNGSDIIRQFDGIENRPDNFARLFAIHSEFSWDDNLTRLVESTGNITGTGRRFIVEEAERTAILASADLAAELTSHPEYLNIGERLRAVIAERRTEVLAAGAMSNPNLRGNRIEQILTGAGHFHRIDDLVFTVEV